MSTPWIEVQRTCCASGKACAGQGSLLCRVVVGLSLYAVVRRGEDEHRALKRLCHGTVRPALATDRVQHQRRRSVVLKPKSTLARRRHRLAMSPQEFIRRLVAVMRPWLHRPVTPSRLSTQLVRCPVWVAMHSFALRPLCIAANYV